MIASRQVAQGDVLFRRAKKVPKEFKRTERKGRLIVSHSETGHHHAIDDTGVVMFDAGDPLRCFLVLESVESCDVIHHRSFDTHAPISLGGGVGAVWEVLRQREYVPDGWRRVED